MKKYLNILLVICLLSAVGYEWHGITTLIQPVTRFTNKDHSPDFVRKSLEYLGCPGSRILSTANGIQIATDKTGISGVLIASLIYTESGFKLDAISPKGYKGIMQTPYASMRYPEVDILHGAMILKDKLHLANGNIFRAIMLYKGGDNPVAKKQARQVLQVYNDVIRKIVLT